MYFVLADDLAHDPPIDRVQAQQEEQPTENGPCMHAVALAQYWCCWPIIPAYILDNLLIS